MKSRDAANLPSFMYSSASCILVFRRHAGDAFLKSEWSEQAAKQASRE